LAADPSQQLEEDKTAMSVRKCLQIAKEKQLDLAITLSLCAKIPLNAVNNYTRKQTILVGAVCSDLLKPSSLEGGENIVPMGDLDFQQRTYELLRCTLLSRTELMRTGVSNQTKQWVRNEVEKAGLTLVDEMIGYDKPWTSPQRNLMRRLVNQIRTFQDIATKVTNRNIRGVELFLD